MPFLIPVRSLLGLCASLFNAGHGWLKDRQGALDRLMKISQHLSSVYISRVLSTGASSEQVFWRSFAGCQFLRIMHP